MTVRAFFIFVLLLMVGASFGQYLSYRFDVGWNLIGGRNTTLVAAYIENLEQIIPPIYGFDNETGTYYATDYLNPGIGYWVLSTDSFTMGPDCDCPPTVTDIDGNIYETVVIGYQCWMAENLKVTHYRDGTTINDPYGGLDSGRSYVYDYDSTNIGTYGLLYNWHAVNDYRGLAPVGWHVPSSREWKELFVYLGMESDVVDGCGMIGTDEGSKMAGGYDLWSDGALRDNPVFGVSGLQVLPAGYRYYSGGFRSLHSTGWFWSSTAETDLEAFFCIISADSPGVGTGGGGKVYGFSVRCVKD